MCSRGPKSEHCSHPQLPSRVCAHRAGPSSHQQPDSGSTSTRAGLGAKTLFYTNEQLGEQWVTQRRLSGWRDAVATAVRTWYQSEKNASSSGSEVDWVCATTSDPFYTPAAAVDNYTIPARQAAWERLKERIDDAVGKKQEVRHPPLHPCRP